MPGPGPLLLLPTGDARPSGIDLRAGCAAAAAALPGSSGPARVWFRLPGGRKLNGPRRWLFWFLLVAPPAAAERLTLAEAVQLALRLNPGAQAARLNAQAAAEIPLQVRAGLFPQLTAQSSVAGAPDDTRIAAGGLNNPIIISRLGFGLTVTQLITDFRRTSRLAAAAAARARAESESARLNRGQLTLEVTRAYLAGLRAQNVERTAQQTLQVRQALLDQTRLLAQNQLKSELDVRFAQVSVSEAELLLTLSRNEKESALADLALALGRTSGADLELVEPPPVSRDLDSLTAHIAQAQQDHPETRQRRLILEAAKLQAEAEDLSRFPTISAIATAGAIPARADRLTRDNYLAAGVNLQLPVLNGRQIAARRAEARLRAEAASRQLTEAENRLARNITATLLSIRAAQERIRLAGELIQQSRQAEELARLRYELGLSTMIELTQAQLSLLSAEVQRLTAQYDLELQWAILDFHLGATP